MTSQGHAAAAELALTGERTGPGIPAENYWFRRHEIAYVALAERCAGAVVLEAGCGEGYGANVLASTAATVIAMDYDEPAIRHAATAYPVVTGVRGNLCCLPARSAGIDVVANFQVIEHLADQAGFLAECFRVLRPGGSLLLSTPNRITFSPGRTTPLNPFHTRELSPDELAELLRDAGFDIQLLHGVHHGPTLRALDAKHGGSLIDAQLAALLGTLPGAGTLPPSLHRDVESVRAEDFVIHGADLDVSLDLLAVAVRP
ncbi:MAG: methyltransferase domain-containing protein [Sciscionella sp.]